MRINAATIKAAVSIASKDQFREVLTGAYIDPTTRTVTVTDSYRLITALAVEIDEGSVERPIIMRASTIKAMKADKHVPFAHDLTTTGENSVEVANRFDGTSMVEPTIIGNFPDYAKLLREAATAERLTSTVTVDALRLAQLLTAMDKIGAHEVTLSFGDPMKPIIITPSKNSDSAALLMPVRPAHDEAAHAIATVAELLKAGE